MQEDRLPIFWEKLKVLSIAVASIATPLVVAFVGNVYSNTSKRAEISMHYVEIATNILKTDPTDNNRAIREWDIETIGHYSEVPLPSGAKEELEIHRLSTMINEIQQNAHEKRLETIEKMKETH